MKSRKFTTTVFYLFLCFLATAQSEPFVYGDELPDAPELAKRGMYTVGVRTFEFVNYNQVDVLNSNKENILFYNRNLKVEMWYPAEIKVGSSVMTTYEDVMGTAGDTLRPLIPFTFKGRAVRDANPKTKEGPYPLLIVSHGYVGSRYLLSYLTENLASKGYIVVSIDHKESTFKDAAGFPSTLLNRSKDISFILDQMDNFGKDDTFLKGLIDVNHTGIIGYSMGGYGVLNVAGAGYSPQLEQFFGAMTGGNTAISALVHHESETHKVIDPRIKAVVAFAPWGMERGVWDLEGLKGLKTPTFFIAGDQDDISGYEKGIKAIFDGAVNADRYLLTYKNARHNVAPNPAPVEALKPGLPFDEYYRYAEPNWDSRRLNNINQHFVTAFMGTYLKNEDHGKYLNLSEQSNDNSWVGFKKRSSTGMEFRHLMP